MMDSSTSIHHQETLESILISTKQPPSQQEKKPRPSDQQALKCPRCDSINTKFCYYNNYSLSQPRYFCKSCRRYWTKGGTLRNVPVGGGCRKNKRSCSSSMSSSTSKRNQGMGGPIPNPIPCLGPIGYDSNDLTLAIARLQKQASSQQQQQQHIGGGGLVEEHDFGIWGNPNHGMSLNDVVVGASSFDPIHHHHHHHHPYYGGGGDLSLIENAGEFQEMGIQFGGYCGVDGGGSVVKQEICGGGGGGAGGGSESRILWGFPWQAIGGGGGGVDGELSGWHGLVNSPLM
ncbi:hypothetical protein M569_07854 [Genlisea aurea]|uniref:Dof zinc finger protein n=1 Tax=Genlisea aurea TaxID=192259 RepID=S8E3T4_9LAMI|nr:hypothetical protein M569_07854 [Genlisea aurea]